MEHNVESYIACAIFTNNFWYWGLDPSLLRWATSLILFKF